MIDRFLIILKVNFYKASATLCMICLDNPGLINCSLMFYFISRFVTILTEHLYKVL